MNVVGGIDIDRKYSLEEIMRLYHKGALGPVALRGYIVRADMDGMVGFVPASESTLFRSPGRNTDTGQWEDSKLLKHDISLDAEKMRQDVEREHPMVRRSAQTKKLALVKRLLESARIYGTIPGLTDAQISAMIGEPWFAGVSIVTQQMLDRVAAYFMGEGEKGNKRADDKRIVKAHPLAHSAT